MKKVFVITGLGLLILFAGIVLANSFSSNNSSNSTLVFNNENNLSEILIKVSIPCEGHVYLINSKLRELEGVKEVEYAQSFKFKVYYDSSKTSKEKILSLNIFKQYAAKEVVE